MDDSRRNVLDLIMIVVGATIILTHLRTILLTTEITTRISHFSGNVDLLILAGLSTRQVVTGTWWRVMRMSLPDHLLTLLPRMGLLLALAQYLYVVPMSSCDQLSIHSYCYYTHNAWHFPAIPYTEYLPLQPVTLQLLMAFTISLGFILMELGLVVAISIWTGFMLPGGKNLAFAGANYHAGSNRLGSPTTHLSGQYF